MAVLIRAQRIEMSEGEVVYTFQNSSGDGRVRIPEADPDAFLVEEGGRFSAVRVMAKAVALRRSTGEWPEHIMVAS